MMRDAYARNHQQFLLFTVLLRHAAGPSSLPISERTSLIQLAINEGLMQDVHLTVSVLVHCLAHLPSLLPPPVFTTGECMVPCASPHGCSSTMSSRKNLATPQRSAEMSPQADSSRPSHLLDGALRYTILFGLKQIASRAEDAIQLMDTLLGVIGRFTFPCAEGGWTSSEETSLLECVVKSAEAVFTFPEEVH